MFAIAIDGPAGAGKSSVAKAAAKELGFTYVDTGAIYRAIALYMLENGVDIEDPAAVTKALPGVEVSLEYGEAGQRTLLGGRDVSEEIRTQEVSMATSKWVAHIPEVREFLVEVQALAAFKPILPTLLVKSLSAAIIIFISGYLLVIALTVCSRLFALIAAITFNSGSFTASLILAAVA